MAEIAILLVRKKNYQTIKGISTSQPICLVKQCVKFVKFTKFAKFTKILQ